MKFSLTKTFVTLLLLLFTALEFICYFLFPRTHKLLGISTQLNSIVGFVAAAFIGLLLLHQSQHKFTSKDNTQMPRWYVAIGLLIIATTTFFLLPRFSFLFAANEINYKVSDIIPQIELILRKFLSGGNAYEPIKAFGYVMYPTYLPAQWFPFILSEKLNIDYRYTPLVIFLITCVLFIWIGRKRPASPLLTIALILPIVIMLNNAGGMFTNPVELLMASYYLLLILAIGGNHFWAIGLGVSLCLLSRYSLVLWLPLLFYVLGRQNLLKMFLTGAVVLIVVLVLYAIPFLREDAGYYFRGLHYYLGATIGEWTINLDRWGKPIHLFNGQGAAVFVYENFAWLSIEQKILLLQKLDAGLSLTITVVLICIYSFVGNRFDSGRFLVATLKIYLAVFYFFIQLPYDYLMVLPFFVSVGSILYFNIFSKES